MYLAVDLAWLCLVSATDGIKMIAFILCADKASQNAGTLEVRHQLQCLSRGV